MKKILITFCFLLSISVQSQQQITLEEAIEIAQKKSPEYKALINQNQASYWRYRNYQAGFLPQLRLDATLPSYSNSINRLTNDQGEDIFVQTNQSRLEGVLSLNQNLAFTGGTLSFSSQLERVDLFTNDATRYSVIPFSINYSQNSLFYNEFKWDKKIEPLMYEEAKRDLIEGMEDISLNTTRRYFALLKAQVQARIAQSNLSNQDTLFQISKGRFKMGKIAENDLLQIELSVLNSKNDVTTNQINIKRTSQNLSRYLDLENENILLDTPKELSTFTVTVEKALEEAKANRKAVIEFRRRRLQAEQDVAEVKGSNRLQLRLNANFGISQQGDVFNELFQDYNQQQNVSLSIGIPILDWGVSKSRRKLVEANKDLVNTNVEQDEQEFEQEIYLHTLNWQNQRNFLETAKKAQEIAIKRYEITKKRFILGKITITDLNLALQEKDNSVLSYLNSLEKFWTDYYTLRRLTLYDFIKNEKIKVKDLIYD
ncbi:transporter [Polaribacter reichenbachii]|uniref:Transporter n=1 Tax=Polaribacter reichenbachii TaxID=996801 RepID=A0A1B8TQC3_9FLAO|nr:TolC family protein [Polaribacter reichenbachii]APZ46727.1 transporter [Polaribacter reichenbachii]AUC17370.1 transporter [Polaribacter reichenbachii]OBY61754.1 transporter [Polaribacter reichenbachii]